MSDVASTGPDRLRFPEGFVWGAATASYQIEGAVSEDGRTPSIWDVYSHTPGMTLNGDTGDVACDHYHRWEQDLDLLSTLGLGAYRFSIAWPRVIPARGGRVNKAGLDFYDRLVDGLLARGIEPLATLYHWDLPVWSQDTGGWLDRQTPYRFAEYAAAVAARLGDRVGSFSTLNEPYCTALLGHGSGRHAPGVRGIETALHAAHHANLAHGMAAIALRENASRPIEVSVVLNVAQVYPATDSAEDAQAARHVDDVSNRIFLEPMLRGSYPDSLLDSLAHHTDWAFIQDGDLRVIHQPLDVLGVNYYTPTYVCAAGPTPADTGTDLSPVPGTDLALSVAPSGELTDMGWAMVPQAFTDLLTRLAKDYPELPLVIAENGCAFDDAPGPDGRVRDQRRIDYLRSHLAAVHTAIQEGADVRGYYQWSLLDNFEWAFGYERRFGLVHVDYDTLTRTPKDSAHWYRDVVAANAVPA